MNEARLPRDKIRQARQRELRDLKVPPPRILHTSAKLQKVVDPASGLAYIVVQKPGVTARKVT